MSWNDWVALRESWRKDIWLIKMKSNCSFLFSEKGLVCLFVSFVGYGRCSAPCSAKKKQTKARNQPNWKRMEWINLIEGKNEMKSIYWWNGILPQQSIKLMNEMAHQAQRGKLLNKEIKTIHQSSFQKEKKWRDWLNLFFFVEGERAFFCFVEFGCPSRFARPFNQKKFLLN